MFLLLKNNEDVSKYVPMYLLTIPFLFIGAKLFGVILNLSEVILKGAPITNEVFSKSGIVFYGGLLGTLLSFYIICKKKDVTLKKGVYDSLAVSIPLFHCFGRIGCFCAGCCYGIENHSIIAVNYSNYIDDMIITISRLPIQLIEASTNLILCIVLLVFNLSGKCKGYLLRIYLIAYATLRFIHEILRADWDREVFRVLSFGQTISILILLALFIIFIRERKRIL